MNTRNYIAQGARQRGLDPRALLAVASVEGGFGGAVGDQGTSFGPFQLHQGGALPHGRGANWANSTAGVDYALDEIAKVARGLHGRQAIASIVRRFERPAAPGAEIQKASSRYGKVGGGAAGVPLAPRPTGFTAAPDKNLLMQQIVGELGHSHPDIGILSSVIQQRQIHPPPSPVDVIGHPGEHPAAGASAVGESVAKIAEKFVGTPYVWGGTTPKGFDCSGLLQYVWKQRGVNIPRTTYDQVHAGQAAKGPLKPGDAIFYRMGPRGPEHVAMFVGGGKMIEAPHRGTNARIVPVRAGYVAARRFG